MTYYFLDLIQTIFSIILKNINETNIKIEDNKLKPCR